jgi:hypothetical protein
LAKSYIGGHTLITDAWLGRSTQGAEHSIDHAAADKVVREVRPPYKPERPSGGKSSKRMRGGKRRPRDSRQEWEKAFRDYRELSDLGIDPLGHAKSRAVMLRLERNFRDDVRDELVTRRVNALDGMWRARHGGLPG